VRVPTRSPRRTVRAKSSPDFILTDRGSTGYHPLVGPKVSSQRRSAADVSRPGGRGPCAGGRRGRRDRRGYASGDGIHGYGYGAGCSAGRCACSRVTPTLVRICGPSPECQAR
jgi:hypothetical protein